jgi:transposase
MRKVSEHLRLKWGCGLSSRAVAQSCRVARSTVAEYLRRAEQAGLSWPLPEELDEAKLETCWSTTPTSSPSKVSP